MTVATDRARGHDQAHLATARTEAEEAPRRGSTMEQSGGSSVGPREGAHALTREGWHRWV